MEAELKQINFQKQQVSYYFTFQKGAIKIFIEDCKHQLVYQGQYSNDNLPEVFLHFFENARDLFTSLQNTDHSCFSLENSSLVLQVVFMNKKKILVLPLQRSQESKQKSQDRKIKRLQQKVKYLELQGVNKDLMIQRLKNQLKKYNFQNAVKNMEIKQQKKCKKFTVNQNCFYSNRYQITGNIIKRTAQFGLIYQIWGNKIEQNEVFTLQIVLKNITDNIIGIGIQSNKLFDSRVINFQNEMIMYNGPTHNTVCLGRTKYVSNSKKVIKNDKLKMVVQNKNKIFLFINNITILQQNIDKQFSSQDLYPFIQLRDLGDQIEII